MLVSPKFVYQMYRNYITNFIISVLNACDDIGFFSDTLQQKMSLSRLTLRKKLKRLAQKTQDYTTFSFLRDIKRKREHFDGLKAILNV